MTKRPPPLGSINATAPAPARIGRKRFIFDSTTKGLVLAARQHGAIAGTIVHAIAGTIVHANFGLGERAYCIVAAPHDNRAGGFWADERR